MNKLLGVLRPKCSAGFFIGLIMVLGPANYSQAVPMVVGIGDFSGGETVIDFEAIAQDEEITTQFSALGPAFSGGLFGDIFSGPPFLGSSVTASNFQSASSPFFNPITVAFSSLVTILGFDTITNDPDDLIIRTFRDMMQTGSFMFDTSPAPLFAGVGDPDGIDRIEIEAPVNSNGAFAIDNFRFEGSVADVPEPSILILLAVGLAGLGLVRQRVS